MATAHLLYGYIGAGKTTLAMQLERELPAVRFTPDSWMVRLFGHDPPEADFRSRTQAVIELLEPLWTQCLACGADVVLDYGFWRRCERDRARRLAAQAGADVRLHVLACEDAEAARRIEMRNADPASSLFIAPATYRALKARLEPAGDDELGC
ncbi:MAG: AAA family ATPase [Caulobacteraceae bacterium]|nr:AAA family ATPase [Caulobacter sp.]